MSSKIITALGLSSNEVSTLVQKALIGGNGGELYMSDTQAFSLGMSNGIIGTPSSSISRGGSIRRINDITADFITFDSFAESALMKALSTMEKMPQNIAPEVHLAAAGTHSNQSYYTQNDVFAGVKLDAFQQKAIDLLQEINVYTRRDSRVENVSISITVVGKHVLIARADGKVVNDYRPTCNLAVSVVLKDGEKSESSSASFGLPMTVTEAFDAKETWEKMVEKAITQASNNLSAIDAVAGNDFDIVIGPGWGGVVLHEAFGHALEADFHAKGNSAFQGMLGKRIAAKGVNVYEDGTIQNARGSCNFDDEGNPTHKNLLVEDGILVGLITDEISAAQLGMKLTGNGRRESYKCKPMPRMTNTCMKAGEGSVDDIIANVKKGYYITEFGGGQVDIVSGKFELSGTQVRVIENGKLGAFVKDASFAGMGNVAYKHVEAIGSDYAISTSGSCGKDGQTVPVTIAQPSMLFSKGSMKVGGTA